MFSIKDKVIVITGAAQGLGREFATKMAEEGAKIVVADIDKEKIKNVVSEIKAAGNEAMEAHINVTDLESCEAMAKEVKEKYGSIDVLINSAAIFSTIKLKNFLELPLEEWNAVIDVNLTGTLIACKACVPYMKEQGWGRIINLTSCSFFEGRGNYVHYVASKAGIIGLTRAIAREMGEFGITANAIAPGATITEVPRETVNEEWIQKVMANRCIKRSETPEDLVGIAVYMSSDESGFMTGQTVVVDGGMVFLP